MLENGNLGKVGATYLQGTVCAPRQYLYHKEATGMGSLKCNRCVGAENALVVTGLKILPGFVYSRIWSRMEIWENWGYLSTRYRVCTKAMFISKGSYAYWVPKNVIAVSVQKTHSSLRASKLPGFVYRRMCSRMEIWGNWGLPISKVPCVHQGNIYITRKLRVWGA